MEVDELSIQVICTNKNLQFVRLWMFGFETLDPSIPGEIWLKLHLLLEDGLLLGNKLFSKRDREYLSISARAKNFEAQPIIL